LQIVCNIKERKKPASVILKGFYQLSRNSSGFAPRSRNVFKLKASFRFASRCPLLSSINGQ
jgi:hypothetical protein